MIHEHMHVRQILLRFSISNRDSFTLSKNNNQVNISEEMIQRFERLFEDMRETLDRQDP